MPLVLSLPDEYGYVALAISSTFVLTTWQMMQVGAARGAAGIKYPQLYAEKAEAESSFAAKRFNCIQRAHANTLETLPITLATTAIAGLRYPVLAASLCGAWVMGRVLYTIGYSSGDPKQRYAYRNMLFSTVGSLGLFLASAATSVQWILKI